MRRPREILKLKHAIGRAHREMAKACEIGARTVSMHLRRAREAGLSRLLPGAFRVRNRSWGIAERTE